MGIFQPKNELEPVLNRIRELELLCEDLKRERRALNLEFTELYDKVSHQMARSAKRARAAAKEFEIPTEPDPTNSHTDSLDPISRSIMVRRGRMKAVE